MEGELYLEDQSNLTPAERLRLFLEVEGINQVQLGRMLKVGSRQTVNSWFQSQIPMRHARTLEKETGVAWEWFYDGLCSRHTDAFRKKLHAAIEKRREERQGNAA